MFLQQNSRFSSRLVASLVSGSWPLQRCQEWAPGHDGPLSNNRVVSYFHNIYATITLVYLADKGLVMGLQLGDIDGFLLGSIQCIIQHHEWQSVRVRLLDGHQLYFSMFNGVSLELSNRDLPSARRASNSFGNRLQYWPSNKMSPIPGSRGFTYWHRISCYSNDTHIIWCPSLESFHKCIHFKKLLQQQVFKKPLVFVVFLPSFPFPSI